MVLGITGGIATGKSTVAALLGECGAPVVSADQLAREAVAPGSDTLAALVAHFGNGIVAPDGRLDRAALAALVFADGRLRAELERITHPAIGRLAEARLAQLRAGGAPLVVYEAPLLFEAGAAGRVDKVLVVTAAPAVQLARLLARGGIDRAEAEARIAAQLPQAEKAERADFVIDNSGTPEQLRTAVFELYRRLLPLCG